MKLSFNIFGGVRSLPLQQKINFARHLAIMIKAGVPLFESLKIIEKQSASKKFRIIAQSLVESVSNGQSLAVGLGRFRSVFGDFFVSVVEVGEASGTLAENLLYLSEEIRKNKALKSKIRSAMIYPMILLVLSVAISAFLTFFIFPKVLPLFSTLTVELPVTTRILIAFSDFMQAYTLWVVVGIIVGLIAIKLLLKVQWIKFLTHKAIFIVPVVSKLSVGVNVANFARVLAVLLKSGVKIVEAVETASGTFSNLLYRKALREAADEIRKGEPLAKSLDAHKTIFPPLFSAMVEVGENTGNLESNLFYVSDYYVEEVDTAVKNLTSFMEPLLLVVMGLIVGFIALSIITPIYSITQGISQ